MGLYEIAGLTVQMDVTGRTQSQAEPYRYREQHASHIPPSPGQSAFGFTAAGKG